MTPILLIPGLVCTAEVFAPQVPALWTQGPVTVASTLEGDSIADIARAILADAPPQFALAGISMGGYLSLEILRQAPQRVTRLALLDTSARPDTAEQAERRTQAVAQARAGHYEAGLAQVYRAMVHPARQDDSTLIGTGVRMGLAVGVDGFARHQQAIMQRIDSRPDLAGIAVPTTVLVGDSDPLTPPALAREMTEAIPQAKLVVIPDSGHASTLEQPEAVTHALLAWLTRAPDR